MIKNVDTFTKPKGQVIILFLAANQTVIKPVKVPNISIRLMG
jgi:hypothetical protein